VTFLEPPAQVLAPERILRIFEVLALLSTSRSRLHEPFKSLIWSRIDPDEPLLDPARASGVWPPGRR